jgi:hypothetical protein
MPYSVEYLTHCGSLRAYVVFAASHRVAADTVAQWGDCLYVVNVELED